MFVTLLIIALVGGASLHFSDLAADSLVQARLLPLLALFACIALAIWLVAFFHRKGVRQTGLSVQTFEAGSYLDGDS